VVGLHGASSNENSFMDFYLGLFKKYAEERGYIALAPIGPGPFGGYWDVGGQEVMDVIDLVEKIYPINRKRIYLTGHSMGGGGTMFLGFNHAKHFAALAPVAGFFGQNAQLAKAKKMPLLIAQGQQDRIVTVESARQLHRAARELKMPNVKYIELEGVGHIQIMASVMKDVFDWFDTYSKKWSPARAKIMSDDRTEAWTEVHARTGSSRSRAYTLRPYVGPEACAAGFPNKPRPYIRETEESTATYISTKVTYLYQTP